MVSKLKYGNTNTFLIRGSNGNLLVDTDYAGTLSAFYRAIKEQDIKVNEITYVLATHYHPDHMGLISELMQQGVKLLLIESQVMHVHYSDEIFARDKRLVYDPINENNAHTISFEKSRDFLKGLGIEGEIIPTQSHSDDSISLVLDTGICLVGDLEPVDYIGAYENNRALADDWERIMRYKPKTICYAHRPCDIME